MKKQNALLWALISVLLLAAAVLALLSQPIIALLCAVLVCIPFLLITRNLNGQISAEQKTTENFSKALEAQEKHHAKELQRLGQSSREELESFRSVLSHQLRMPLSIVQGFADLLIKDMAESEEEKKEYLQKIFIRTQYMSDILSNQLSLYRNMDEVEPVFQKADLISLLRRVGEDMQTVAKNQGVEIQFISSLDSLYMDADSYQLNKVMFNIIENSLKYMGREGHVNIVTSSDGENAHITIKDDGMGLDIEETSHIFELNYQGSNKKEGRGYGHGLYLAQRAVQAHGGSIAATSAPGMGMAIKISLPLSQQRTEAES